MKNKKVIAALVAAVIAGVAAFAKMNGEAVNPVVLDAVGNAVTAQLLGDTDDDDGDTSPKGLVLEAAGRPMKGKGR
jgi:hypothetical protein